MKGGFIMENDLIRRSDSYDHATLADWYITSVDGSSPVWTNEHIEELLNDFYVIPKEGIPAVDAVERGVFEQVAWERDMAIAQLKDIGKGLGEKMDDVVKVVRCRECFNWYGPDDGREHSCMVDAWMRPGDWFCPCGRREE